MIFIDSSAWFARYSPRDKFHRAAFDFLQQERELLITTDYVVDEVLTLLKARGNYDRALMIGPQLLSSSLAELVWVGPQDVEAAWDIYRRFQDKDWSFTDCVSYAVIQRLKIPRAMAFDEHFRQFGIAEIVPA